MKCDELKDHWEYPNGPMVMRRKVYYKDDVDAAIAELKAKLESVQASMYADVVDAGMENRKTQRALWLARAKRAENAVTNWCPECMKKWNEVERKCRAKAEEYR